MPIKSKTKERPLTAEGSHMARIVRIVEFGTQETNYNNNVGEQHQVRYTFELPDEMHIYKEGEEAKPSWISPFPYNVAFSKKSTLTKHFKALVGEKWGGDYDLGDMINMPCMVSIVHNKSGNDIYANIDSVIPCPKGTTVGKLQNDPLVYSIDDHGFSGEVWDKLSEWEQERIAESAEFLDQPENYAKQIDDQSNHNASEDNFTGHTNH